MANTRDRRVINPPIHFRYDLDPIDRDQSSCHPPLNNGFSTLPGSARPVSVTYFQSTDLCPFCQTSNHRNSGRYCASCGIFYHLACARLKKAECSGFRTWLCQRCLFPTTCNPLFPTAVNSTFYEQTSAERAGTADGLPQLRWQC